MSDNDMNDDVPIPKVFSQGAEAAKESGKTASFQKTVFFSLEDGQSQRVRFLTDNTHWLVAKQHNNVPTKPEPADYKGNSYPKGMSATCRYDQMFQSIYNDCYICDVLIPATANEKGMKKIKKPNGRDWALLVLREEVVGDGSDELGGPEYKGKIVGYRDVKREEQKTDDKGNPTETVVVPDIQVANFAYSNFFQTLDGYAGHWGTILDRDIIVKREGGGRDTTYNMIPDGPVDFFNENGEKDGILDVRRSEVHKRYDLKPCECGDGGLMVRGHIAGSLDLHREISFRASDKWFSMWFIPGDGDDASEDGDDEGSASSTKPSQGDVPKEQLQALADRIQRPNGASEGETASTGRDLG